MDTEAPELVVVLSDLGNQVRLIRCLLARNPFPILEMIKIRADEMSSYFKIPIVCRGYCFQFQMLSKRNEMNSDCVSFSPKHILSCRRHLPSARRPASGLLTKENRERDHFALFGVWTWERSTRDSSRGGCAPALARSS